MNALASGGAMDKVADTIIRGIRSGAFVPGQHLVEPDLMQRIGISRGSLREALKHLSVAGIVTLNRFRGAYIAALNRKTTLDLLDVLEPLACLAARLAAQHCDTRDKRQAMRSASVAVEEANRSRNRLLYLEQRRNFYSVLIAIGGNSELERVMPLNRADLFRAQAETLKTERQRVRHVVGYAKVTRAVIDQNVLAADRAVQHHFEATRKTIREMPDHAFQEMIPVEDARLS